MKHQRKSQEGMVKQQTRRLPEKSYHDLQWEQHFAQLRHYKKENGHCNVPQGVKGHPRDEQILATWCARQRRQYKSKTLPDVRRRKLESVGFEFYPLDAQWERYYQSLLKFYKKYRHCNVPGVWEDENGLRLGSWVIDVRGQDIRLTEERKQRLDRVEFIWNLREYIWEEYYQQLVAFKARYGHCNVSEQSKDYGELGTWVGRMRMIKRQSRQQHATADQLQRLEKLGVEWEPRDHLWEKNFQTLVKFKKKHGHCYMPFKPEEDQTLANWVHAQRRRRKSLSPERVRRLDKLGFEWNGVKAYREHTDNEMLSLEWEKNFAALVVYKKKHGHCHVPSQKRLGGVLSHWVMLQRQDQKRGVLTAKQVGQLEALGFQWDGRKAFRLRNNLPEAGIPTYGKPLKPVKMTKTWEKLWQENFRALVNFKKKHDHCHVPLRDTGYPRLGSWVYNQRRDRSFLPEEKVRRLEKIGFEWDSKKAYRKRNGLPEVDWQGNFRALVKFKKKYGHSHVPLREALFSILGRWVYIQRRDRNLLSSQQVRCLEEVGFEWSNRKALSLRKELQRTNGKTRLQKDIIKAALEMSTRVVKSKKRNGKA